MESAPPEPVIGPSMEGATQVVFHLPEPVDLERGQSLLVPIASRTMPAERVSVYRHDVDETNPIASVRLDNQGGTSLPPGLCAMYEREESDALLSFVGDAKLGALPAGESRMLGYAIDLDVKVDREEKSAQMLTGATIDRGVLVVRRVEQRKTTYTIAGAANEPRVVIVEHPRVAGFDLVRGTLDIVGTTEDHWRVREEVLAGQTVTLDLVLERPIEQRVVIGSMAEGELGMLVSAAEISADVRATLGQVAELRRTLASRKQALAAITEERTSLVADQDRLRKNLEATPDGSELHSRYLEALGTTEDRIGELDLRIDAAKAAVRDAEQALADFLQTLSL